MQWGLCRNYVEVPSHNNLLLARKEPSTVATAISKISEGAVTSVTVTNGGSGYTEAPTIYFVGGGTEKI